MRESRIYGPFTMDFIMYAKHTGPLILGFDHSLSGRGGRSVFRRSQLSKGGGGTRIYRLGEPEVPSQAKNLGPGKCSCVNGHRELVFRGRSPQAGGFGGCQSWPESDRIYYCRAFNHLCKRVLFPLSKVLLNLGPFTVFYWGY